MNKGIGNGWQIKHLTDRVIELHKDDVAYRRMTGSDGVVRVRAEVGMDRGLLIERALIQANRSDEQLAIRVAADNMPSGKDFANYRNACRTIARNNHTGEESFVIGAKSA